MMRHAILFSAAFVATALPVAAQKTAVQQAGVRSPYQQLAHDIYKELVEINSGMKTGNVTPAATAMAKRFRDAGIPDSDIFVGGPRPDKYNVVARIHARPGASARKPLLLLAHLDVVEALKADWSPDLAPSCSWSATATTTVAAPRTTRQWRPSSSRTQLA